jgi:hypothetical protein
MITAGTVRALSDPALSSRYRVALKELHAAYREGALVSTELSDDFDHLCTEQIRRLIERRERAREYRATVAKCSECGCAPRLSHIDLCEPCAENIGSRHDEDPYASARRECDSDAEARAIDRA